MISTVEEAKRLLYAADLFYARPEEKQEYEDLNIIEDYEFDLNHLNLNDTWGWACADCQKVEEEEFPELARLFWLYGKCGVLYWASKKTDPPTRSEFHDINRFIDFVENEERVLKKIPSSTKRAYYKTEYTIKGEGSNGKINRFRRFWGFLKKRFRPDNRSAEKA